jgi:hypothetical protein
VSPAKQKKNYSLPPIQTSSSFPDLLLQSFDMSCGQGYRFSRMSRRATANRSSMVTRLASRSITGHDVPIQVHQHRGFTLHIVWEFDRNGVPSKACVHRQFLFYDDVDKFCRELIQGWSQGLYSFVCDRPVQSLSENVEVCLRVTPIESDYNSNIPRWWDKSVQDCTCRAPECFKLSSSAHFLEWEPWIPHIPVAGPDWCKTLLLLQAFEEHLGPIDTWPSYILRYLFADHSTSVRPTKLKEVIAFSFGNDVASGLACWFYRACNWQATMFVNEQFQEWYCVWQRCRYKPHLARYYNMRLGKFLYINGLYLNQLEPVLSEVMVTDFGIDNTGSSWACWILYAQRNADVNMWDKICVLVISAVSFQATSFSLYSAM